MPTRPTTVWIFAFGLALIQVSVALFAVASSRENILSDGACIGGIFGTLANLLILAVVAAGVLFFTAKSVKAKEWHPWLPPLLLLALSSALAIAIGQHAALRCTV